jgi:hypothetical protein
VTSDPVVLTEGDNNVVWTFTVKRAGVVEDLTGKTVLLYVHDDDIVEGTNIINGSACTLSDPSNGKCTFTFLTAHTTISGTGRVLKGRYKLKVNSESFDDGPFRIEKDAFTA